MSVRFLHGDCRAILPTLDAESFDCIVTSPPYFGLRDYGCDGQIGLEPTLDAYIKALCGVFDELWRVLKPSGTAWLNLGDSYAGSRGAQSREHAGKHAPNVSALSANQVTAAFKTKRTGSLGRYPGLKPKDLIGVPWRVAFALQSRGWWLRSAIVWAKPNPMPESVTDRPTSAYEMVFLLTKSSAYFYDADAIAEPMGGASAARYAYGFGGAKNTHLKATDKPTAVVGNRVATETRNARNVWTIATQPFKGSHFATMPPELAERCIKAGCPTQGRVLDPFGGAGTTGLVADRMGRHATLIELNLAYRDMAAERVRNDAPLFSRAAE